MITLRDATRADFETWFGYPPANTLRATVGEEDGELVGIGGVVYGEDRKPKAFMDVRAGVSSRAMIRGVRRVLDMMKREHRIAFAVANDDERAPRFLEHFGFKCIRHSEQGAIYQWVR